MRSIIEQAARREGLPPRNVVADISSISILRTSLLAGLGHTLLPPMPLRHELDAGLLVATEVKRPALTRHVVLCTSRHLPLSAAATAVAALTGPLCRELARSGRWQGAMPVATPD